MRSEPSVQTSERIIDRWFPVVALVALFGNTTVDVLSRYYWVDEVLTATLVTDPSLVHMLRALVDQVDTSPPLFYIVAWVWAKVLGAEAASLRMLSTLFAAGAFLIVWRLLARYTNPSIRAVALGACFLVPTVVFRQVSEARPYGLLLLLTAWTLWEVDRLTNEDAADTRSLLRVAAIQAALALTHTLGVMYGVAALVAIVAADLGRGRRRPKVYLAWMAGPVAFLAWLPALRSQLQVGVPSFPIPVPGVRHLLDGLSLGVASRPILIFLALALIAIRIARHTEPSTEAPRSSRGPRGVLVAAGLWVAAAFALWVFSRVARPLFLPRYLVPLSLAYGVLVSLAIQHAVDRARADSAAGFKAGDQLAPAGSHVLVFAVILVLVLVVPTTRAASASVSGRPGGDSLEVIQDLPIATISTHTYLPRAHYAAQPNRYAFILDWPTATRPGALVGPTEYNLMAAMGRNYPDHWVEQGEAFLARHPRFLLIDEAGVYWFRDRILTSPNHKVTLKYRQLLCGSGLPEDRCRVYLVERLAPSP